MSRRNVTTSELGRKFQMNANTVKIVLKKARVKPAAVHKTKEREFAEWPNRASNAALRAFRAAVPVHGHVKSFNTKKKVSASPATVTNINDARLRRRVDKIETDTAELHTALREAISSMRDLTKTITAGAAKFG